MKGIGGLALRKGNYQRHDLFKSSHLSGNKLYFADSIMAIRLSQKDIRQREGCFDLRLADILPLQRLSGFSDREAVSNLPPTEHDQFFSLYSRAFLLVRFRPG
jgi:hypothetical protein